MNVEYYRVILKVNEFGNITKAAENMGYTQSGVSSIIGRVEEEFNRPIFIRLRSGVRVAPDAEPVLEIMRQLVRLEDSLYHATMGCDPFRVHSLRVGAFRSAALLWLPKLISEYMKWCHFTRFDIHERTHYAYVVDEIINDELDMGFVEQSYVKNLDFYPLYEDQYYVITPYCHELAKHQEIEVEQLHEYPFIVPEDAMGNRVLREMIQKIDTSTTPHVQMLDDRIIISMVEEGMGISLVPGMLLHNTSYRIEVRPLKLEAPRVIGLAMRKGRINDPIVRKFFNFTKKWIEQWGKEEALFGEETQDSEQVRKLSVI